MFPPTHYLDPYIEEAEARWDSVFTKVDATCLSGNTRLVYILAGLLEECFSRRLLEDAIIDQCDKLIQDLAERLYERAQDRAKGYD